MATIKQLDIDWAKTYSMSAAWMRRTPVILRKKLSRQKLHDFLRQLPVLLNARYILESAPTFQEPTPAPERLRKS